MRIGSTWLGFLALSLASCQLLGEEPVHVQEEFDGFFPVEVRSTKAAVLDGLGRPDEHMIGDFPGEMAWYREGPYATLKLLFLDQHRGHQLRHWTAHVTVGAPFAQLTRHGLGIGSSKRSVRDVLGTPGATEISTQWSEIGWSTSVRDADIYFGGKETVYIVTYDAGDQVDSFQQLILRYNPPD